jgi:hypothetical protein
VGSIPRWVWFVLIVGGIALFDWYRSRKRREALAELANSLGLIFGPDDWYPRLAPSLESRHFARTRSQSFQNILSGDLAGFSVSFFDHVIGGKGGHTDTIASFTQSIALPTFSLEAGGLLTEIADVAIRHRIDFSLEDAAFSDRFRLVGFDGDRVRKLFTIDMRAFLTTLDPKWRIEASGNSLLIYRRGHKVKPEDYANFIEETSQIAGNFFNHRHLEKSGS